MSSIEERLTQRIIRKASSSTLLTVAAAVTVLASYVTIAWVPALGGILFVAGMAMFIALARRKSGLRFLPEGIAEMGKNGIETFIPYADIGRVQHTRDEVVIEAPSRTLRLGRDGSPEPFVRDIVAELAEYLEAKVAEARALADDRADVVAFLARGVPAGDDDYRSFPAPRSALEAIARSRVMPARLRVEAAAALGEDAPEVELSEELSNASENERRRV